MRFNKSRMATLSGLLREGKEEEGKNEADEAKMKDVKETDEVDECGETYEVDEADVKEIEESIQIRRIVRGELEQMWASGQVFGKKAGKTKGVTLGFTGVGFKR